MTYADHQEAAARALADLVFSAAIVDEADPMNVLLCRRAALRTVTERMQHLGAADDRRRPTRSVAVAQVVTNPLWQLYGLVARLPQPAVADVAPSDLLPRRNSEPFAAVAAWRSAARELFLATSELQRAEDQPWTFQAEAAWYLVGDVADTVGAVVALDAALSRAGVLPPMRGGAVAAQLLIAGDVARLARMHRVDAAPDGATAGAVALIADGGPAIHLIRSPADLVVAQRRLSGFVRPIRSDSDPGTAADRPGLRAARGIAAGQARLSKRFAEWADATSGAEGLADQFRARVRLYRDLHASTSRLVDVQRHRSALPLIQQSEMVTGLRALGPVLPNLSVLTQLNEASHDVAVSLGKALKREALYAQSIRVMASEDAGPPLPQRITNTRNSFYRACRGLTEDPVPPTLHDARMRGTERARLRAAIDEFRLPPSRSPRRMPTSVAGSSGSGRSL